MSNFIKSSSVRIESDKYDVITKAEPKDLVERVKKPAAEEAPVGVISERRNADTQEMYAEKGNAFLDEAKEQARAILEEASGQAAQMVSEARERADDIEKLAYEKGRQQALSVSIETIGQAKQILEESLAKKEDLMALWEREMIHLSVEIARKVIGDSIEIDSYALTQIYKNAVDRIKAENDQIRLKLGPGNFNLIIPDELGVEVVVEKKAGDNEIIVETENGEVNISIDSQIELIRRGFQTLMGEL